MSNDRSDQQYPYASQSSNISSRAPFGGVPGTNTAYPSQGYSPPQYYPSPTSPETAGNDWLRDFVHRRQAGILTPEERQILEECRSNSLWFRAIPLSVIGLAVANAFYRRSPASARQKFIGYSITALFGYGLGRLSYANTCFKKLQEYELQAIKSGSLGGQSGTFGGALQNPGLPYSVPTDRNQAAQTWPSSQADSYGPMMSDSNQQSIISQRNTDSNGRKTMNYDDLRRQNRSRFWGQEQQTGQLGGYSSSPGTYPPGPGTYPPGPGTYPPPSNSGQPFYPPYTGGQQQPTQIGSNSGSSEIDYHDNRRVLSENEGYQTFSRGSTFSKDVSTPFKF